MDRVQREIVTRYKVDGIFTNRWDGQRRLLLRALPAEFQGGDRVRAAARTDARDPGRRRFLEWRKDRLTELWKHWDATIRAVNPDARFIPNGPPDLKTRRRAGARSSSRTIRRAAASRRRGRTATAPRSTARSWAGGRSAASSASASRSRTAGRTPCRASRRSGSGSPRARPTACARGSRSFPACSTIAAGCRSSSASTSGTPTTSATCATRCRWRAWRCCTPSRRRRSIPAWPRATAPPITCSACTTRSSRRACRSRWCTRRFSQPDRLDQFKLLILADAAALSDAQCAAIRAYVERGGSVLATFATSLVRRAGAPARRLRSRGSLRRVVRRPRSTGRCRTPI